ncbi:hypothetical protein [Microbacterium sp.]|uniref:hypothetical protein n=1 Tax=Microbacterium sp. TaxID=51671 RepID=UPI002812685C|nr:hypothetical protein [Microbacterium sp.]
MTEAKSADREPDRWAFGTVSSDASGIVNMEIGEEADPDEVSRVQAALDLVQAFEPDSFSDEFARAAELLLGSLKAQADAGGRASAATARQIAAATNAWLSSFSRLRADMESKEERFGNGDATRARFRRLYREDWHYRLIHELRNVSQHEGNAHSYIYAGAKLGEDDEHIESYEIDVERLYAESRVRGLEGLRQLDPGNPRADLLAAIEHVEKLHDEALMWLLFSQAEALEDAFATIVAVIRNYSKDRARLHLFRLNDLRARERGERVNLQLRSVEWSKLPGFALTLSLARAHVRAAQREIRADSPT